MTGIYSSSGSLSGKVENQHQTEEKVYSRKEFLSTLRGKIESEKKAHADRTEEYDNRLTMLEKSVNKELSENESIQISELDLQKFVSQENFPPEEIHEFLRARKAIDEKEGKEKQNITETTRTEKKSLISNLKDQGEGLVKKGQELVLNGATSIQEKIKEFTEMSPAKRWVYGHLLGFGAGILGILGSVAAWFGYDAWKNKAEYLKKLKDALKDPKAALEKMKNETLEKVKGEGRSAQGEEKEKGTLEKISPLLALTGISTGLLSIATARFPSFGKRISSENGANLLKKLPGMKVLKLCGKTGLLLGGIGAITIYLSEHNSLASDFPTDPEKQKTWWSATLDKIPTLGEAKDDLYKLLVEGGKGLNYAGKIVTGDALKEKLETEGADEGYVFLQDSQMLEEGKRMLKGIQFKIERLMHSHPNEFRALLGFIGMGLGIGVVLSSVKIADVMKNLLIYLGKQGKQHPYLCMAGLALGASGGMNMWEGIKHIQVKQDASIEDIQDMILGFDESTEIAEGLVEFAPNGLKPYTTEIVDALKDGGAGFGIWAKTTYDHFLENLDAGIRNALDKDANEKISEVSAHGLSAFAAEFGERGMQEKESKYSYKALFGDDYRGGIVAEMRKKCESDSPLFTTDIHKLISATKGTNIRIFPEGGDRETGRYIQWCLIDEGGNPSFPPKNICPNPALQLREQEDAARDFDYDPTSRGFFNGLSKNAVNTWEKLWSDIAKAGTSEKPGELKGIVKRIWDMGGVLVWFNGEMMIKAGASMIKLPLKLPFEVFSGEDVAQEMLVEYGGAIVPVMIITSLKNKALTGNLHLGKSLVESALYPVKTFKIGGYIVNRMKAHDLAGVIHDPALMIKNGLIGSLKRIGGLAAEYTYIFKDLGLILKAEGKLQQYYALLKQADMLEKAYPDKHAAHGVFEKIQTMFTKYPELLEALGRDPGNTSIGHLNEHNLTGLLVEAEGSLRNTQANITGLYEKVRPDIVNDLAKMQEYTDADRKTHTVEETAHAMREDAKKQLAELEAKKQSLETKIKTQENALRKNSGNVDIEDEIKMAKKELENLMKTYHGHHQDLREIIEGTSQALHAQNHGHGGKIDWRTSAREKAPKAFKGLLWVVGALGAGYAINRGVHWLRGEANHVEYTPINSDDVDYYGYGREETASEKVNTFGMSVEKCENVDEFAQRMKSIGEEYTTDVGKFLNEDWIIHASENEVQATIEKLSSDHMYRVEKIMQLIGKNKQFAEEFMENIQKNAQGVEQAGYQLIGEKLREQGIEAFTLLTKKDGATTLEYMNQQDMKKLLLNVYQARNKGQMKNVEGTIQDAIGSKAEFALRVLPFTGAAMSGVDAYDSFKEGNIKDGLWNVGWCVGGLALDIFSFGLAGTAARTAVSVGKGLVIHTGGMLVGQGVQEYFNVPRSESVKISNLQDSTLLP